MPFANFKVPEKTLTLKQKEEIVTRTTELYVEIYGERARDSTVVLVEEVADDGWDGHEKRRQGRGRPSTCQERPVRVPSSASVPTSLSWIFSRLR